MIRYLFLVVIVLVSSVTSTRAQESTCGASSTLDLAVGDVVVVNPSEAQNVREQATVGAEKLVAVPPGEYLTVWGGPVCADGYRWWQVEYDRQVGWTAEGPADGNGFWLHRIETQIFEVGDVYFQISTEIADVISYADYDTNYGDGFDVPAHRLFALETSPFVPDPSQYLWYWHGIPVHGGVMIAPRTDMVDNWQEFLTLQSVLDNHAFRFAELMSFVEVRSATDRPHLTYLPLVGGKAERWLGYPDPRGLKPDRYVPVGHMFRYYLCGLSSDGQYYVSAMFPVGVDVELPPFPDLPPGKEQAAAAYAEYLQVVNSTLDDLPPLAFNPRLTLLDAMLRSMQVTREIELRFGR